MILKIVLINGLYSEMWYVDIMHVNEMILILYIYSTITTEVNVSAPVGMSATVEDVCEILNRF